MKILLVRPHPHKDSIGLHKFMICEPLELEYLGAAVAGLGIEVRIVDMILEKKPLAFFLNEFKPDLVAFTAYISHVGVVKGYAATVKRRNPECKTLVGGVHAEVVSGDFQDASIDFIMNVNSLQSFRDLVIQLQDGKAGRMEAAEFAGGSCLHINGKAVFPDRTLTAQYRARYNYIFHEKCALLKTSYGCAYQCEFCFCIEITRHTFSERNMEEVIEELKMIDEKNVFIVDDNFLFREERMWLFLDLLKTNNIRKNFILFGRADFIAAHEPVMAALAQAGLKAVFVGIESFKDDELSNLNKRTSVEMNLKAIGILEKYDIECYSGIIVGMDWEDKDFKTLSRWLNRFKWPVVNIQPITPMPGTALYEKLKSKITVSRERYELWDMAHLVMKPEKISRRRYYWYIIRTYLTSSVSPHASAQLIRKYGFRIYFHCIKGVLYILGQYLKLVVKG